MVVGLHVRAIQDARIDERLVQLGLFRAAGVKLVEDHERVSAQGVQVRFVEFAVVENAILKTFRTLLNHVRFPTHVAHSRKDPNFFGLDHKGVVVVRAH